MTRSGIKPGYIIKLNNGSIYTIYMVENIKYVCLPQAHHMCLRLAEICNEDLSPVKGISPIVKIFDNFGGLVHKREETITVSMEQIAKMLNVPVSQLRIKEQVIFVTKQEKIQHIVLLMRLFSYFLINSHKNFDVFTNVSIIINNNF